MTIDETVELLKALADPTRLRLAALLYERGTLCVCELEEVMALPQYAVSRHLGVLRRAGVAQGQRTGARMDYRLQDGLPEAARQVIAGAVGLVAGEELLSRDREAARLVRPDACGGDPCGSPAGEAP